MTDNIIQEDYNKMRKALQKCRNLFRDNKKKLINKHDYEKAAKMRTYEKICTNALRPIDKENYYSIIATERGITANIVSNSFVSRLGFLTLVEMRLRQDKEELFDKLVSNEIIKE